MRRLRYNVAVSLDGFIARPGGEYDWIVMDPTVDFAALFREFDTLVMGRRTFDNLRAQGADAPAFGMKLVVVSRTLTATDYPGAVVFHDDISQQIAALKEEAGKDIWLFGGGVLFRSLLDAGLVDSVELAVMPILLGEGRPVLPPGADSGPLRLSGSRILPSGIALLSYEVPAARGRRGE